MKKLLLLLFIFPLFIACSSDDDDNKYYWEIYISNWKEIKCTPHPMLKGYPTTTSYKITQSEMDGWIDQINNNFEKLNNEGEIDCLPIAAYRKADK